MPEKILGLDISQDTIKAVLLERKGRLSGTILAFETIKINECGGVEQALAKLGGNEMFVGVPCCASLPVKDILFRHITLPFSDDGKIRKTLPFELEPVIPFSIDQIAADYLPLGNGQLLVAVTSRQSIESWISIIEGSLGEALVIDVSSLPVVSLLSAKNANFCGVLLDIGSDATMLNFYEQGSLVEVRSLSFGTKKIIQAMAKDYSLSTAEAEQIMLSGNHGSVQEKLQNTLLSFFMEVRNTMDFLLLNGILENTPVKITLTGGGALFSPIVREMGNYFKIPVEIFNLQQDKKVEIDEKIRAAYNPLTMNGALACALMLTANIRSFNLRQGELKRRKTNPGLQTSFKWAMPVALLLLVLATVSFFLDYGLQVRKLENIKKQIAYIFKKNYPDAAAMVEPVSQLKTKLAENKKSLGFYEAGLDVPVIDLFKDISGHIPSSLDIVLTNLSYESETVLLRGEARSIDDVTAVKNELMKSQYFKEINIGSTSLARQGGKVEFDLRITLR